MEALKEHFRNSKFLCETKAYLPVVFSPPRDGRQLTDPLPIAGHNATKASDDDDDDDEDDEDGLHQLNNGDHVCDCGDDDDDIADYDDQPPNGGDNGDDEDDI